MGRLTFAAGALCMVAFLSFLDGVLSLESMSFVIVVPLLLSIGGFALLAAVDPQLLAAGSDFSASAFRSTGDDPMLIVRHRASFVAGATLLMTSTAVALTVNGFGETVSGCARDNVASSWPGFAVVFQGWLWLLAAVALYVDKCAVPGGAAMSILSGGNDGE